MDILTRRTLLYAIFCVLFSLYFSSAFSYEKIARIPLEKVVLAQQGGKSIWHITTSSDKGHVDYIKVQNKEDSLYVLADGLLSKYIQTSDGLYLISSETPNYLLSYRPNQLDVIPFYLQLNDSVKTPYHATGLYCGKYDMKISGEQSIKLIGIGKIVENHRDTIDNVMLLVRENIADASISIPRKQSLSPIRKKEKSYFWVDAAKHHVILSQEKQELFIGERLVSHKSVSYKYQCVSSDGGEKSINEQSVAHTGVFEYNLKVTEKKLKIYYSSNEPNDIKIQICDMTGILYKSSSYSKEKLVSRGVLDIDLSHLRKGVYVTYIYMLMVKFKAKLSAYDFET